MYFTDGNDRKWERQENTAMSAGAVEEEPNGSVLDGPELSDERAEHVVNQLHPHLAKPID